MLRLLRHYMPRNDEGAAPRNDKRRHASQHNSTKVILTRHIVRSSINMYKYS